MSAIKIMPKYKEQKKFLINNLSFNIYYNIIKYIFYYNELSFNKLILNILKIFIDKMFLIQFLFIIKGVINLI